MQNVSVQHSNGPGLIGSFCDVNIWDGLFKSNAGGIQLASKSELTVQTSSFSENEAVHDGGAISCTDCSSVHVNDSIFENNVAPRGGAIAVIVDGDGEGIVAVEVGCWCVGPATRGWIDGRGTVGGFSGNREIGAVG